MLAGTPSIPRRRAAVVRTYLASKGIATEWMQLIALGKRRPLAPNAWLDGSGDGDGRARNRRVDIEVVVATASQPPPSSPVQAAPPR